MSFEMTNEKKALLLEELSENEAFLAEMKEVSSKKDIQDLFAKYGLEMSREEVDMFVTTANASLTELDEANLEEVAGGVDPFTVFVWAYNGTKVIAKKCWNAGRKFANWEASW